MSTDIKGIPVLSLAKWLTATNLGYSGEKMDPAIKGDVTAVESFMLTTFRKCLRDHNAEGVDIGEELKGWFDDLRTDKKTRAMIENDLTKQFGL